MLKLLVVGVENNFFDLGGNFFYVSWVLVYVFEKFNREFFLKIIFIVLIIVEFVKYLEFGKIEIFLFFLVL